MSRSLNKVMLIGNVGKEPDVNFTAQGIPVAQFRLATTETHKDKDGQYREHTEWHTIIAWRGLAEIVQRLVHRGSRVYIEGKLQTRIFDDASGNKKYFTEVVADNMLLLDAKKPEESSAGQFESAKGSTEESSEGGQDES
jgi:single-strand DNA-binding protein